MRTVHHSDTRSRAAKSVRIRVIVEGAVQGIGFRPFVYRLARSLGIAGTVSNTPAGVAIEAEGLPADVRQFLCRLKTERPPLSRVENLRVVDLPPRGDCRFSIATSDSNGQTSAFVMPDIAVCAECLRELRDPAERRYRYPFINCTHCGPRFSIMHAIPYDRPNTTMRSFRMCAQCRIEYEDPGDRRFHAQPIACPACGPEISVWNAAGEVYASGHDALQMAATEIRAGRIVALKGLGGFQLIVDARDARAVARLRMRKHRDEKPFAVLYPDLEALRADSAVSSLESSLLMSPESPIVILRRSRRAHVADNIAPNVATIGALLPYTPLHHLLMDEIGFPVVATSGNISDEPICIDEYEALDRLGGIADFFLVHNRPIARQMDDSIVRVIGGREVVLRRARGYAPLPVNCGEDGPPVLAVGAHLKNTVAISNGPNIFLSQHIGDLETVTAHDAFLHEIQSLQHLFNTTPQHVASDLHPGYLSAKYAQDCGVPVSTVQHHYAHVLACMAEHKLNGPVLGVSWDGAGLGTDGTIWGGEFLRADRDTFERVAHLREFQLLGGDQAAREPRRAALSILADTYDSFLPIESLPTLRAFDVSERAVLISMLARKLYSPLTTSAARLFEAVASIMGASQRASFEGQAAMALEALFIADAPSNQRYTFEVVKRNGCMVLDWAPLVRAIVHDVLGGVPREHIATGFHHALSEAVVEIAQRVGERDVVLSGGCFQNAALSECTIKGLQARGFHPYWHRFVPPNDGGIALGQALYALHRVNKGSSACA